MECILESQGKLCLLNLFAQFLLGQGDGYDTDVWSCTIQICLWELQTKLLFPLPQTNFWQRRQLRRKLTKCGAEPAKGEVQASYFMFLTGQRLLAGLKFWLLVKFSGSRYDFCTLHKKCGRISLIINQSLSTFRVSRVWFILPSERDRHSSTLRSFAFLACCYLQRISYKPNGNHSYPVFYIALDY